MIELINDQLTFSFPEVHEDATCSIEFQRTLRIPDDNREYRLPPGLGRFPVQHVDDFTDSLPDQWRQRGGVFLPMYQSEALWVNFSGHYPCAVKVAAGKINAVSGEPWKNGLSTEKQDYAVIPDQPWLDGFNVSDDFIRQFVAMPLGQGFTAEEQLTEEAVHGGLQIIVYPMKRDIYDEMFKRSDDIMFFRRKGMIQNFCVSGVQEMGLAPGGLMRQTISKDKYGIDTWDLDNGYRCFVHLANSEQYQAITGQQPPHPPTTAKKYTDARLPWFDYYSDAPTLSGSEVLGNLTSVATKSIQKGDGPLSANDPVKPVKVITVRQGAAVRDGKF